MKISFLNLMACGLFLVAAIGCGKAERDPIHACCSKPANPPASARPGDLSIYQLPGVWTDQHHHQVELSDLEGKVVVMAMIFTRCGYACPQLVENMKAIEDGLSAGDRDQVRFVLVTFDTDRDSVAQLNRYAAQKGLRGWTLLRGTAQEVRQLSVLMDVPFQQLDSGDFTHANRITLLDRQGKIAGRLEGLTPLTSQALSMVTGMLADDR